MSDWRVRRNTYICVRQSTPVLGQGSSCASRSRASRQAPPDPSDAALEASVSAQARSLDYKHIVRKVCSAISVSIEAIINGFSIFSGRKAIPHLPVTTSAIGKRGLLELRTLKKNTFPLASPATPQCDFGAIATAVTPSCAAITETTRPSVRSQRRRVLS